MVQISILHFSFFFPIELFCSVKNLICLHFISLLFHLFTIVFFLPCPRKLSKGENERAVRLAYDYEVGVSALLTNLDNPYLVLGGSSFPGSSDPATTQAVFSHMPTETRGSCVCD